MEWLGEATGFVDGTMLDREGGVGRVFRGRVVVHAGGGGIGERVSHFWTTELMRVERMTSTLRKTTLRRNVEVEVLHREMFYRMRGLLKGGVVEGGGSTRLQSVVSAAIKTSH